MSRLARKPRKHRRRPVTIAIAVHGINELLDDLQLIRVRLSDMRAALNTAQRKDKS